MPVITHTKKKNNTKKTLKTDKGRVCVVQQENIQNVGASDIGEFPPTYWYFSTWTSPSESSEKASLIEWAWRRGAAAEKA